MADFADSCLHPDMEENRLRLPISSEKPADVASLYSISSSLPDAAKNDGEEFKKLHQSHREASEASWKLISGGNQSSENASIEQEVSRYQTYNKVTALQGDKDDVYCSRSNDRCGIHEDMLFDIMLWLPVASLLRFRSVCRLWCSIIDSSTFIIQHYNHNSNKNCLLAHHVVSSNDDDHGFKFCLLSGNKYEVYSNLDYKQSWYSINEITILNSCHGIVSLLDVKSENVALWNPATKQLRPIPESHQRLSLYNGMISRFGFGFDSKRNDYKFVKILYHNQNEHNNLVEVYSLKTDSWKVIHKDDVLPFKYIDCYVATCNKETCFWIGYAHHGKISPILISFDLNSEVFETMSLPGEYHYDYYAYHGLHLLNDKLYFIKDAKLKPFESRQRYFEIWMLDEYGVKESWKNICKFEPLDSLGRHVILKVVGLSKNGESLIVGLSNFNAREEEYLALRILKPLPSKDVSFYKVQNPNPFPSKFVHFNESLVSLAREDDDAFE